MESQTPITDSTSEVEGAVKQAEFAFLVIKQKDGRYAIANVDNKETERQPALEDVFTALVTLQRDLDRQALAMSVVAALQQQQSAEAGSGLVVPEKKFVKRS